MKKQEFAAHINPSGAVQTVQDHCLQTATFAQQCLCHVGLGNAGYLAGLLHDCGKMHPDFSKYIWDAVSDKGAQRGSVIHTFAGVYYFLQKFHDGNLKEHIYQNLTAELLAYAVGAHHGFFDLHNRDGVVGFAHRLTKQPNYECTAIENFNAEIASDEEIKEYFKNAQQEVSTAFAALRKISREADDLYFYLTMLCRLISSAVMDGDRRDTASFMTGIPMDVTQTDAAFWQKSVALLETKLETFLCETPVQKARKELSDHCRAFAENPAGIYRLNIPTGGGKTLSGLRYAMHHCRLHGKKRIFYLAPLISILEQNAQVIKDFAPPDTVLEHHSDVLVEEEGTENRRFLEETWDAPIIATTLVQFLQTLFSSKTTCARRMQALCNSVIIIDEVQSVPTKMLHQFNLAMNFLQSVCHCTVLLCSATQPALELLPCPIMDTQDMIPPALYQHYDKVFQRNVVQDAGGFQLKEIPNYIAQIAEQYDSVLVICNKKDEAEYLFHSLACPDKECYHLSAGMCIAHRKTVIKNLFDSLRAGRQVICIATQVMEAGVDVSFGAVIRFGAGMDSVVQAAGRCNRNGEKECDAPVFILQCLDENLTRLPDIAKGKSATEQLLLDYQNDPAKYEGNLSSPQAIAFYFNRFYKSYAQNHFDFVLKEKPSLLELLSHNRTYCAGDSAAQYLLRSAPKTAGDEFQVFDESTTSVLVPYGEGETEIGYLMDYYNQKDYAALHRQICRVKPYAITVYGFALKKLQEDNAVYPICDGMFFLLDAGYYDPETGIIISKEGTQCNTLIL